MFFLFLLHLDFFFDGICWVLLLSWLPSQSVTAGAASTSASRPSLTGPESDHIDHKEPRSTNQNWDSVFVAINSVASGTKLIYIYMHTYPCIACQKINRILAELVQLRRNLASDLQKAQFFWASWPFATHAEHSLHLCHPVNRTRRHWSWLVKPPAEPRGADIQGPWQPNGARHRQKPRVEVEVMGGSQHCSNM